MEEDNPDREEKAIQVEDELEGLGYSDESDYTSSTSESSAEHAHAKKEDSSKEPHSEKEQASSSKHRKDAHAEREHSGSSKHGKESHAKKEHLSSSSKHTKEESGEMEGSSEEPARKERSVSSSKHEKGSHAKKEHLSSSSKHSKEESAEKEVSSEEHARKERSVSKHAKDESAEKESSSSKHSKKESADKESSSEEHARKERSVSKHAKKESAEKEGSSEGHAKKERSASKHSKEESAERDGSSEGHARKERSSSKHSKEESAEGSSSSRKRSHGKTDSDKSDSSSSSSSDDDSSSSDSSDEKPDKTKATPVRESKDEGGLFVAPIERAKVADRTPPVDLDNEAYRSAAAAFMSKGTLPDKPDRAAVYMYLNREATSAAVARNYDGAEKYYQATKRYLEACHESERSEIKDTKKDELEAMIEETNAKLEQVRAEWKDRIGAVETDFKERTEDAKRQNEQEMEEFRDHWADPDSMRAFSKPSSSLISLRDTERKMVLVGMYKRAKEVKEKADALQQRETAEAQANAVNEVTTRRDQLLKSQQDKLDRIQKLGEKKVTDMKRRQQTEENGIEKRLDNLKVQLKMSMTRRSVPGLVRPITNVRARSMTVSEPVVGVKAPQSRNQMYRFSKTSYVKKLTLQPLSQYKKGGAPKSESEAI